MTRRRQVGEAISRVVGGGLIAAAVAAGASYGASYVFVIPLGTLSVVLVLTGIVYGLGRLPMQSFGRGGAIPLLGYRMFQSARWAAFAGLVVFLIIGAIGRFRPSALVAGGLIAVAVALIYSGLGRLYSRISANKGQN